MSKSDLKKNNPSEKPLKFYHLTDKSRFKLDPNFAPHDNTFALQDRSGQKGIYLAPDVGPWKAQGYHRPFVAEFHVDPSVLKEQGVHGRWHGEVFVPASAFHKLTLHRVVPVDALTREECGLHGIYETEAQKEFDTGNPITAKPWERPFKGYKYTGKDVRDMAPEEVTKIKQNFRAGRKMFKSEQTHPYNNWVPNSDQGIANEYEWEYKNHWGHSGLFPTFKDFHHAVKNAKIVQVTPELDRQIGNRSRTQSIEDLKDLTSSYRFPRDVDRISQGFAENHPIPHPIVIKKNGRMTVMSGNTRMDNAFIHGIHPHVALLDLDDPMHKSETHEYPTINENHGWNGMVLRPLGSSLRSIRSSFEKYKTQKGIKELPFSHFSDPNKHFYNAQDHRRAENLAHEISQNKEIEPLIVGLDKKGPYILEGQHRFVALHKLGHKTFPALIVEDHGDHEDSLAKSELAKGTKSKRFPFNPLKDTDPRQEEMVSNWIHNWTPENEDNEEFHPRDWRNSITKDSGPMRERLLQKLMGKTKVRRSSLDGGREYLLHRGVDDMDNEFSIMNENTVGPNHVEHTHNTSWTPDWKVAYSFAHPENKEGIGGNVVSAWIHENNILTSPAQYGKLAHPEHVFANDDGEIDYRANVRPDSAKFNKEQEIVVAPHRSERKQVPQFGTPFSDINERVTARGQKDTAGFNSPKYIRYIAKAEPQSTVRLGQAGKDFRYNYKSFHEMHPEDQKLARKFFQGKDIPEYQYPHNVITDRLVHSTRWKAPVAKADIKIPKKKFIEEHTKLLDVLRHPTKQKVQEEIKEQSGELKELKKGLTPEELKAQGYRFKLFQGGRFGPSGAGIIAYHGRKKIGHLAFRNHAYGQPHSESDPADPRWQRVGYHGVYNSDINQEHRGKGIYQHMLKLANEHAKSRGGKGLMSEGYQRSGDATRAWDKVASHANPYTNNAKVSQKLSARHADYFMRSEDVAKKEIGPKCKATLKRISAKKGWRYPSAVANINAGRWCKDMRKADKSGGLWRWAREKWENKHGETGKGSGKSGWRPTVKVSSKTPETWGEMTPAEKRKKTENKRKANKRGGGWSTHLKGRKQVYNTKKSEALNKTRPKLRFPHLGVDPRSEQNVQLLTTGRQKDIFGRKVAQAEFPPAYTQELQRMNPKASPEAVKAHVEKQRKKSKVEAASAYGRNQLGVNYRIDQTPFRQPKSLQSALGGTLRSRHEDFDEGHKQRVSEAKEKHRQATEKYYEDLKQWRSAEPETRVDEWGSYDKWDKWRNLKPKQPTFRTPSKKRIATEKLSPEQQKLRGQTVDTTIEHEALHGVFDQIGRKHGPNAELKARNHILGAFDTKTLGMLSAYIRDLGYKTSHPGFSEELLTHARDILVNPEKRKQIKRQIDLAHLDRPLQGQKAYETFMTNLKRQWQEAYNRSQNLKPADLEGKD